MPASHQLSPLEGRSVLIVEDEFLIADEICSLVERLGGTVVGPVPKVTAALDALRTAKPDIALLDINLHGERVYAVAEALRAAGTPFLFTSGYDAGAIDPHFRDIPRLEKPVSLPALTTALTKLI